MGKRILSISFMLYAICSVLNLSILAQNPEVRWDRHSLIIDGKRVVPVMGEVHYSRIPVSEWADEIRKM